MSICVVSDNVDAPRSSATRSTSGEQPAAQTLVATIGVDLELDEVQALLRGREVDGRTGQCSPPRHQRATETHRLHRAPGHDAPGVTRFDRKVFHHAMQRQADPRSRVNRSLMKTDHFEGWAAVWMRYAVGALAAISKLEPEADWRQIVSEIVLGTPPHNDIGERWGASPGGSAFTQATA